MVLTSLFAAGSVLWMQRKFEAGDERNALAVVQAYRARHASIPEVLESRHPSRPIAWSTATESACFQHVRVHAVIEEPGQEPSLYAFTVDINGPSIHPANEGGRAVLAALDTPLPPAPLRAPSASPSAPSSSAPSSVLAPSAPAASCPPPSATATGASTQGHSGP
jgi:hypothetical protein